MRVAAGCHFGPILHPLHISIHMPRQSGPSQMILPLTMQECEEKLLERARLQSLARDGRWSRVTYLFGCHLTALHQIVVPREAGWQLLETTAERLQHHSLVETAQPHPVASLPPRHRHHQRAPAVLIDEPADTPQPVDGNISQDVSRNRADLHEPVAALHGNASGCR